MTEIEPITVRHMRCLSCGAAMSSVDHLFAEPRSFGTWYCDGCGKGHRGEVRGGVLRAELVPGEELKQTSVVLELPPQGKPVYFLVRGMRFTKERLADADCADRDRFFYEEHSCPTNWLEPIEILHDGDTDAHGLIKYVGTIERPPRDDANDPELPSLLALLEVPV